jgi:hypothetical protein
MKKLVASMLVLFMGITISAQDLQKATTKGAVRLFGDKDDLTSVLMLIPAGSNVEIIKSDIDFTLVRFDNAEGFVKSDNLSPVTVREVQPANQTEYVAQPQSQYQAEAQPEYQPADRYEMLTMKYGSDIGKRLYQHKVWKGLNTEMAGDSWGKPRQINRTYVDQSVDEEWIYSKKWLYFRDDILIEWGPVK